MIKTLEAVSVVAVSSVQSRSSGPTEGEKVLPLSGAVSRIGYRRDKKMLTKSSVSM